MRKRTCNNPNLDLFNMHAYNNILRISLNLFSRYRAETKLWRKSSGPTLEMTGNNPNLDLVHINAYTKFEKNLSICSQDIERKRNYDRLNDGITDGWTDGRNDGQPKSNIGPNFLNIIPTKQMCRDVSGFRKCCILVVCLQLSTNIGMQLFIQRLEFLI